LESGKAWEKFKTLVKAQGGDVSYITEPERLPQAPLVENVPAPRSGYLSGINARVVGETAVALGGGRIRKGDPIDHAVGLVVHYKVGDWVEAGKILFTIHANRIVDVERARDLVLDAHSLSDDPVEALPLFYGVVK
jgi:pyrimidine-nucleoside phosphorylase